LTEDKAAAIQTQTQFSINPIAKSIMRSKKQLYNGNLFQASLIKSKKTLAKA